MRNEQINFSNKKKLIEFKNNLTIISIVDVGGIRRIHINFNYKGESVRESSRKRSKLMQAIESEYGLKNLRVKVTGKFDDPLSRFEEIVCNLVRYSLEDEAELISVDVTTGGNVDLLIVVAMEPPDRKKVFFDKLRKIIDPVVDKAGLTLRNIDIQFEGPKALARVAVLRACRVKSPASLSDIVGYLSEWFGHNIDSDSVANAVDALRKEGAIVYLGSERYAITLQGIRSLPGSKHGKSSVDVERALDLARRMW